ncbi:MAG: type II secretion system protein [Methylophaga sp.]|nr:type II secretion system protein [Methylophaga sp.]
MFFQLNRTIKQQKQLGFTLLELLVVIALLAIVAGVVITSYDGVQDQGRADATKFEMAELRKALLQFRRDNRELPCRVYRDGNYVPDNTGITQLDFTNLPSTPSVADYYLWCENSHTDQVDWGLTLLLAFPYDNTDTAYTPLLWNPDTKHGWNGPYVNNQGLVDGWGNRFALLDPELDYSPHYRCKENSGDYDTTGDLYSCLTANDASWNAVTYTLPANIVRLVSFGPNGSYEGDNITAPCLPNTDSDDLILCLLR